MSIPQLEQMIQEYDITIAATPPSYARDTLIGKRDALKEELKQLGAGSTNYLLIGGGLLAAWYLFIR